MPSGTPEDRDATRLWRAADVVREGDGGPRDLALAGLAAELKRVLVDHPHAGGAGRMAERLETAVGVDRELAAERERAASDVLLPRALRTEAEVFVAEELGHGEAV